jgi:hypothetical protein
MIEIRTSAAVMQALDTAVREELAGKVTVIDSVPSTTMVIENTHAPMYNSEFKTGQQARRERRRYERRNGNI